MNRLDPDLEHLGAALHASATIDLAREERAAHTSDAGRARHADPRVATRAGRPRRRILAGSTLGLAGVGAGLVLALSGTTAIAPAFAVTREANGTVLVTVNTDQTTQPWVLGADQKLASMGIHEQINIATASGAATVRGGVSCTGVAGPAIVDGKYVAGTPSGPPVKVLLGKDGTDVVPGGTTGAGTVHLTSCVYYSDGPGTQVGNSGSGN